MFDINGVKIEVGQTVKTIQPSGGILPPSTPETGMVENCIDAFGNSTFQIRYRKSFRNFDQFILLKHKINEVI